MLFRSDVCEDTGFLNSGKPCACYQQERIKLSYKHSNLTTILDAENFNTYNLDVFSKDYSESLKKSPQQHMSEVKKQEKLRSIKNSGIN